MARSNATLQALVDAVFNCIEKVTAGNWFAASLDTLLAGEDQTNHLIKVENRYSYQRVTGGTLIKSGAGFVHTVTFSATGAVTAGAIALYDNTSASGNLIWTGIIQTGLNPVTIKLDVEFSTGLHVEYDGTINNVATTVSYR